LCAENAAAIIAAQATLNTAMNTAFSTFIASTAVTTARIQTLITNICTAVAPGFVAACTGTPVGTGGQLQLGFFQFIDQTGASNNWPVNMVVLTDWVTTNKTATGSLTYTRDNAAIPGAMIWAGSCSNTSFFNSAACTSGGGAWTSGRTCFGTVAGTGEVGTCRNMPSDYANLMAIQEDINILQMTRFTAMTGSPGSGDQAVEKAFTDKLYTTITGLIGGTTNGTTAISAVQKKAIVTLMSPPQM